MRVVVRYFARLRELRDCASEALELDGPTSVSGLYASLFPPGPAGALPVMYAVNQSYVQPAHVLADGDEIAFIPPLGGG
jgi:molybdopterin converting factor subunit 1